MFMIVAEFGSHYNILSAVGRREETGQSWLPFWQIMSSPAIDDDDAFLSHPTTLIPWAK